MRSVGLINFAGDNQIHNSKKRVYVRESSDETIFLQIVKAAR